MLQSLLDTDMHDGRVSKVGSTVVEGDVECVTAESLHFGGNKTLFVGLPRPACMLCDISSHMLEIACGNFDLPGECSVTRAAIFV